MSAISHRFMDEGASCEHRNKLLQLAKSGNLRNPKSRKKLLHPELQTVAIKSNPATPQKLAKKVVSLEELARNGPTHPPRTEPTLPVKPARSKNGKWVSKTNEKTWNSAEDAQDPPCTCDPARIRRRLLRKRAESATAAAGGQAIPSQGTIDQTNNESHQPVVSQEAKELVMSTARGPNVSVLHLRSTSEPWESACYPRNQAPSLRSSRISQVNSSCVVPSATLLKNAMASNLNRRKNSDLLSKENGCARELSPVRWCNQEVDGVFLGRSGWVQVQHKSFDDNRRVPPTKPSLDPSGKPPHSNSLRLNVTDTNISDSDTVSLNSVLSSRSNFTSYSDSQRLTKVPHLKNLKSNENAVTSPMSPIISPPPAFQDESDRFEAFSCRPKTLVGRAFNFTRSNAVEGSPPCSPPLHRSWSVSPKTPQSLGPSRPRKLSQSPVSSQPSPKIPHTRSFDDTTRTMSRRSQFHKYSSSSSSSSAGFRSFDSTLNRAAGLPKLLATESPVGYEDADEDDNHSSLNLSGHSSITVINSSPDSIPENKVSKPRGDKYHHRQMRERAKKNDMSHNFCTSPSSSSSSDYSPISSVPFRRSVSHNSHYLHSSKDSLNSHHSNDSLSKSNKVKRSRSFQVAERTSPVGLLSSRMKNEEMLQNRMMVNQRPNSRQSSENSFSQKPRSILSERMSKSEELEDEVRKEAEEEARIITEYLYGSRSQEAARALLIHRYFDPPDNINKKNKAKILQDQSIDIYLVPKNGNPQKPKVLQRGVTAPFMANKSPSPSETFHTNSNPCNPNVCEFWPHCAHLYQDGPVKFRSKVTAASTTKLPQNSLLRTSNSYSNSEKDIYEKENKKTNQGYHSAMSSPASLERVNDEPRNGNDSHMLNGKLSPTTGCSTRPRSNRSVTGHHKPPSSSETSKMSEAYPRANDLNLKRASSDAYRYRLISRDSKDPREQNGAAGPQRRVSSVDPPSLANHVGSFTSSSSGSCGLNSERSVKHSAENGVSNSPSPHSDRKIEVYGIGIPSSVLINSPVNAKSDKRWKSEAQQRSLSLPKSFQAVTQTAHPKR